MADNSVLYCIGRSFDQGGSGYIGQDSGGMYGRLETHFRNIFKGSPHKDGASEIIKQYGIGGLFYGYGTADENYGLSFETINQFCQYCCISIDDLRNNYNLLHLSEFCHIYFNNGDFKSDDITTKGDVAGQNKAIGGGGLKLDLKNGPPIKNLMNNTEYSEKIPKLMEGKNATGRGSTILQIADVYDLIRNPGNQNKIIYAPRYIFISICRRLIPDIALISGKNNLVQYLTSYDFIVQICQSVQDNIFTKIQTILQEKITSLLNESIKQIMIDARYDTNEYGEIDWNLLFGELPLQLSKELSEYGVWLFRSISNKLKKGMSLSKNDFSKNRTKTIKLKNFIAKNSLVKRTASFATAKSKERPKGIDLAKNDCIGGRKVPDENHRYSESTIKQIAFKYFVEVYEQVKRDNVLNVLLTNPMVKELNLSGLPEKEWLTTRMRKYYNETLGFGNSSTTLVNGDKSYKCLMSLIVEPQFHHPIDDSQYGRVTTKNSNVGEIYTYYTGHYRFINYVSSYTQFNLESLFMSYF